jgi:CBS domain-containing protein/anti-sigma regulatory factor (Ser/Thr protein kinase)
LVAQKPNSLDDKREVTKIQEIVHELKVGDVMTTNLITVSPKAKMSDLREILRKNRISGLPVVEDGKLVGIISIEDFIKALAERENHYLIEDKMTQGVEAMHPDDPLVFAFDKFEHSGLGRFPVVDRQTGELVGILTKGDVIQGLLKKLEIDYHKEEIHRYRASHIFEDIEADFTALSFRYYVMGKDFKRAGQASSRLKRTLNRLGIKADIVRRLAIASYEAEMNLVIFTEGGTIGARVEPSRVYLRVNDSGPGIPDVEKAMQAGYSTAGDWVREIGFGAGMGLPNMKRMSDEFEIESEEGKGTLLRMSFFTGDLKHESR